LRRSPAPGVAPDGQVCADGNGAIREQLQRILASPRFGVTERLKRFLAYVVEEALQGRGNRIKAYTVATDVFGRGASFDAHSDPIVRVEAGHLRQALERYYLTDGTADKVIITIPKGSYQPRFETRVAAPERRLGQSVRRLIVVAAMLLVLAGAAAAFVMVMRRPAVVDADLPYLAVVPFKALSGGDEGGANADGFTQTVITELARSRDIVVIDATAEAMHNDFLSSHARYALAGSVGISAGRLQLRARLFDTETSGVLWGQSADESLDNAGRPEVEQRLARSIAMALAQPFGAIFRAESSRSVERPAGDGDTYGCLLAYYRYRIDLDARQIEDIRSCLASATARHPDNATAWALRAQLDIDEIRFQTVGAPLDRQGTVTRALEAARRAVVLDPENVRALQAEMLARFFLGDNDGALEAGRRAVALKSNDLEVVGEYGFRLALSGRWNEGCPLVASAKDQMMGPVGYFESMLAVCAYMGGSYTEAASWIRKAALSANPQYHLIAAVVYPEAGLMDEARREADWLRANAPRFVANLREEIKLRLRRPEDQDKVFGSLAKTGLL
jgi:TolB-like protein